MDTQSTRQLMALAESEYVAGLEACYTVTEQQQHVDKTILELDALYHRAPVDLRAKIQRIIEALRGLRLLRSVDMLHRVGARHSETEEAIQEAEQRAMESNAATLLASSWEY